MPPSPEGHLPRILVPVGVAPPTSHYSHAAIASGFVFVAGQVGIAPDGTMAGDGSVQAQARQVFDNIESILDEAGSSLEHVVRFVTYVVGRENVAGFKEVRTALFERVYGEGSYPPHTLVIVSGLASREYLVEVETTALLSGRRKPD